LVPPPPVQDLPPSGGRFKLPSQPVLTGQRGIKEPVLQLVGHVMSPNDLSNLPDSPIFNIKKTGQSGLGGSGSDGKVKTKPSPFQQDVTSIESGTEVAEEEEETTGTGRSSGEETRSPRVIGLPFQLKSVGRGMPAPLVWISPASLARSPMVSLRQLENTNSVERTLTMTFPGRPKNRFTQTCLECISIMGSRSQCSMCFVI